MPADTDPVAKLIEALPPLELLRIAAMPECERLSSADTDTLRVALAQHLASNTTSGSR